LLTIRGAVSNLTTGLHGVHVHTYGDLGNGCLNAGAHYNPFNKTHGSPMAAERHVGDLGNWPRLSLRVNDAWWRMLTTNVLCQAISWPMRVEWRRW
jgi:Cu/Zn superoxide dismutase